MFKNGSFSKRYGSQLRLGVKIIDITLIILSWVLSYLIFNGFTFEGAYKSIFEINSAIPIIVTIFVVTITMAWSGLYGARRTAHLSSEYALIFKSISISVLFLLSTSFFLKSNLSRITIAYFFVFSNISLISFRTCLRLLLQHLRKKGLNTRHVLIIGSGDMGRKLLEKIQKNSWMGLKVVGFLDDKYKLNQKINNVPVIGKIEQVKDILKVYNIDQIFISLPLGAYKKVDYIMKKLHDELVTIRLVPQISYMISAAVENIEGIPIITLVENPTLGFDAVSKRIFDICFSFFVLILISPIMLIIALLVMLTSRGPIFYKQERMGLDGRVFGMLKYRSMSVGAEKGIGAVWAIKDDPRTTKIGAFLRKTSLDELPQFINVLKGDMSIVGPRPERPPLIDKFKKEIPMYMWRHKIKTGITGWAQVNGWRGNTSLSKRIECDLYYIENWSFLFDIKIIFLTVFKGFVNKNAY
ncbi:MAG: undecaprenyl-phosphate glucose phosphotransferase [Pseudomonadota bacterium]